MFRVWPALSTKVGEDCFRLERRWDVTSANSASSESLLSRRSLTPEINAQLAATDVLDQERACSPGSPSTQPFTSDRITRDTSDTNPVIAIDEACVHPATEPLGARQITVPSAPDKSTRRRTHEERMERFLD